MDLSNYSPKELHDELLENVQYDDAWDSQEELLLEVCKAILDRNLDVLTSTVATGNGKTEVARVLMTTLNYLSDQGVIVVFITTNNQLLAEMEELAHNGENILVMAGKNNFVCETAVRVSESDEDFVLDDGTVRSIKNLHFKASNSLSKQYAEHFDYEKYGVCCNYQQFVTKGFELENTQHCEYVRRMKKMEDILRGDINGAIASNMDHFLANRVYKKDIKTGNDREIDLLLVDEADKMREKVEEHAEIEINSSMLRKFTAHSGDTLREPKLYNFGSNAKKEDSRNEFETLITHYMSGFEEAVDKLSSSAMNEKEYQLQQKFYELKENYERYMFYKEESDYIAYDAEGEELGKKNSDGWRVKAIPIDIGDMFKKHLANVDTTMMMSATINENTSTVFQLDDFAECRHVDISDERGYHTNLVLCPADISGSLTTGRDGRYKKEDFKQSMEVLNFLLTDTIHKKEKGIVHTTSYKKADQIVQGLQNRGHSHRVVRNPRADEEEDLSKGMMSIETFRETEEPLIMVAVNKFRGVDLKQSQGRFNVIFSAPFPNMYSPKHVEKRDFVDNLMGINEDRKPYLQYQTITDVIREVQQASGRTSRTPEDYSAVYILDERFKWVWEKDGKGKARPWFVDKFSFCSSNKGTRHSKMKDFKEEMKGKLGEKGTYMRQREKMKEEGKVLFESDQQYEDTIQLMREKPLHKRVVPADGTKSLDSLNTDNSPYKEEASVSQPEMQHPSTDSKSNNSSNSSKSSDEQSEEESSTDLEDDDFEISEPREPRFRT